MPDNESLEIPVPRSHQQHHHRKVLVEPPGHPLPSRSDAQLGENAHQDLDSPLARALERQNEEVEPGLAGITTLMATGLIPRTGQPEEALIQEAQASVKPIRPTQADIENFERARDSGSYGPFKLIKESVDHGRRVLEMKEPESGTKVFFAEGADKKLANLYYVENPTTAQEANEAAASLWLEGVLRPYEVNPNTRDMLNEIIPQNIKDSLDATIRQHFNALAPAEKARLVNRALGRIGYHNSAVLAKLSGKDFSTEFASRSTPLEANVEIMRTPGVQEVLQHFVNTQGEYFRLRTTAPAGAPGPARPARAYREAYLTNTLIPQLTATMPAGTTPDQIGAAARLAFELSEKTMHAWGESAYYDGIRVLPGATFMRNGVAVAGVPVLGPDNWISQEVVEALYPNVPGQRPLSLQERYAQFFIEFWNTLDIDVTDEDGFLTPPPAGHPAFGQPTYEGTCFTGQGASHFRQAQWYPIQLTKEATTNKGEARYLQRFAYLWTTSLVRFSNQSIQPSDDIIQFINFNLADPDPERHYRGLRGALVAINTWAPAISKAVENRGKLNDVGDASILNLPLIEPNELVVALDPESFEKAAEAVMKNFLGLDEIYVFLLTSRPDLMRQMRAGWLMGLLTYPNRPERPIDAHGKFGTWLDWDSRTREDLLLWLQLTKKQIAYQQSQGIQQFAQINQAASDWQGSGRTLGAGFLAAMQRAMMGIVRTK